MRNAAGAIRVQITAPFAGRLVSDADAHPRQTMSLGSVVMPRLFLSRHRYDCDALNVLEILMIHRNQGKIPLTRHCSDPSICRRDRPSG
jgi:hypothetical protein